MYISSIPQSNGNSIKLSLSTQTRRVIKSSQTKLLYGAPKHICRTKFDEIFCSEPITLRCSNLRRGGEYKRTIPKSTPDTPVTMS